MRAAIATLFFFAAGCAGNDVCAGHDTSSYFCLSLHLTDAWFAGTGLDTHVDEIRADVEASPSLSDTSRIIIVSGSAMRDAAKLPVNVPLLLQFPDGWVDRPALFGTVVGYRGGAPMGIISFYWQIDAPTGRMTMTMPLNPAELDQCENGDLDGDESDIDCGSAGTPLNDAAFTSAVWMKDRCPRCHTGASCTFDDNCVSYTCNTKGSCL